MTQIPLLEFRVLIIRGLIQILASRRTEFASLVKKSERIENPSTTRKANWRAAK